MKAFCMALLFCLVAGATINGFIGAGNTAMPPATEEKPLVEDGTAPASEVPEVTDNSFDTDVLKSETPVFVDFSAEWCGPCKQMAPVVAKLASQYEGRVKFYKVDTDRSPSVTARYNVNSIPTMIMFKGGKRGESFTGVVPQSELTASIDKTLE